jgi:hypothetical protein
MFVPNIFIFVNVQNMNANKGYTTYIDESNQPHNVVLITDASKLFDARNRLIGDLAGRDVVLMLMRAGCGWCTKFKPVFAQAADSNPSTHVVFAMVDIGADPYFARLLENRGVMLKIEGVPEVASYSKGMYNSKFDGERTVGDLHLYAAQLGRVKPKRGRGGQ